MEVIFFLFVVTLGLAAASAAGTYHIAHNQLVKAGNRNAKLISWFLSLCSFGLVIVVIYFVILNNLRFER